MRSTVGFIGVGTIATAMIKGLRMTWPEIVIRLSPRSAAMSAELATGDPLIHREASNAAVVATSDIVVLTMLPTQLDAAVAGLPFRGDQIIVSCVAGTSLDGLAVLTAPARVCRLVPLPMVARREGPILLHPAWPEVRELFAPVGDLITPGDENGFSALVAGSAAMSTFLTLEGAISDWITAHGASAKDATIYVRSLFRALAETAHLDRSGDVSALVAGHETPGGLNARVRRHLQGRGWFDEPGAAFDGIARLGRHDLGADRGS